MPLPSSTQPLTTGQSIPFSIAHQFTNLRLFELPPDLLQLLDSDSDSRPEKLYFKSITPESTSRRSSTLHSRDEEDGTEGMLHLVTTNDDDNTAEGKVWMVRQVSTSNSVYILQPTATSTHPSLLPVEDVDERDTGHEIDGAQHGMTAIAKVGNVLELIEVKKLGVDEQGAKQDVVVKKGESDKKSGKVDWHARLGRDRKR